ncbi:hypothetical protein B0T22DRAFT_24805 [Podospora appendiculata]|uniref:Serine-rich protein n=1 Tax=Podospora appendiculata TaxID=314037 RepID=A0AAE1CFV0_9PEZI|nr:hypothetical protein B0T22DRAFT_24805 [Podospora appendiculata]
MSAPSDRHGRTTPLRERLQPNQNPLAIRIVPYTPPRIDPEERVPSQTSSRPQSSLPWSGNLDDQGSSSAGNARRPSWHRQGTDWEDASSPGSALSSSSDSSIPLAKGQGDGVSGSKLAGNPSATAPRGRPTATALRSPSEVSTIGGATNTSTPEASTPKPQPRPLSRRRNYIAVNADKTFSLVRPAVQSDVSGSFRSPILSYSSGTTISHERPSVDAWSEDRPSSALTSTASIPDNSPSDFGSAAPSPGTLTKPLAEDPISSSPWNYRMAGGLRKVPKTPDLKQKKSNFTTASSATEKPLDPLPEVDVYWDSQAIPLRVVPKASFTSTASAQTTQSRSTSSETANYKVYGATSSAQQSDDNLPLPSLSRTNYGLTIESSPPLESSPTPNYQVYGPSSSAQDSRDSLPLPSSSHSNYGLLSETSSVANYEVYGTSSSAANYEVYGSSSSAQQSVNSDPLPSLPGSSHSNYELLGESSPSVNYRVLNESSPPRGFDSSPPATSDGSENFVVHGDPSPPASVSANAPRLPRPTYSRESLLVPPLKPARKISYERVGYYKQRSRESLRGRAGSLQSLKTTGIGNQDTAPGLLVASALIGTETSLSRHTRGVSLGTATQQQHPWSGQQAGSSTGSSTAQSATSQRPQAQMIPAQPHQWSSQLSTVISESDSASEHDPSRSVSPVSLSSGGTIQRARSSNGWAGSLHSRQMQSISSSLAAQLDDTASGSDSVDRPQPTYARAANLQNRTVWNQDEHGDGLTELQVQPSRSGLSGFFSSTNSSGRNLHSSGSSRANSVNSSPIPAWAKVYYGSGERRFLGAPSISASDAGDSRPPSSNFYGNDSPNTDQFPAAIQGNRKRTKDGYLSPGQGPFSDEASMDITPAPGNNDYGVFRTMKKKTSSIWSPHLRQDRRASRYSVWDPPSVSWSADTGILGKRNAQVVLFLVGFIFPFAWMIAALLPLPPNPKLQMLERGDNSNSQYKSTQREVRPQPGVVDETRYESARWWRNLNRAMSFVGLIIIGAVVALAVVGVKQGFART